jgi:hypothetical protein
LRPSLAKEQRKLQQMASWMVKIGIVGSSSPNGKLKLQKSINS